MHTSILADDDADQVRPLVPQPWEPYTRVFALAAELTKTTDGFELGTYQGAVMLARNILRTPDEAIELLRTGEVVEISLDHDLGLLDGKREETGYDVLLWLEEQVATASFAPPEVITVHSSNASAAPKMERAIASIRRLASRPDARPD